MKRFASQHQLLIVILLLLTCISLRAQQFPISVNTILTTPALPYLEDFIQENSNALMTTVSLNDPTTQSFDIGLRLTISGQGITITSDPLYLGEVYTLTQGVPTILTGFELAEYFDVDHLVFAGISKQQYLAQGRLPEGLYSICFEAYDINSPNTLPVSNTGCGVGMIEEYDPPVILSLLGESPFLPSQNYIFSWQPLHPGNFDVTYYIDIWEKIDGISDADLILSETPYSQIEVSNFTNYVYSLVDPLLQPSTDYLMRIQVEDPTGQFLFKNNGYSEPQSFSLTEDCVVGEPCDDNDPCTENDTYDAFCSCIGTLIPNCDDSEIPCSLQSPPVVEMADEIEDFSFIANWSGETGCFDYVLLEWARDEEYLDEYESVVIENVNEFSFVVDNVDLLGGDYFYRLSGFIGNEPSPYSENMLVSQNRCKSLSAEVMDYACGILDSTVLNQVPLLVNLDVGAKVYASDWLVEITEVSGSNRFFGRAKVTNDALPQAQINLVFSDIAVNQDCQMVDGFMEVEGFGLALISPEISAMLDSFIVGIDMALDALDIYEAVVNSVNDIINETEGINDYISGDWDLTDGVGDIWDEYPYLDEDIVNSVQDALDCFTASAVVNIDTCLAELQDALAELQDAIEDQYNSTYQVKFLEEQNEIYGYDLYEYPEMRDFYDEIEIAGLPYRIPWLMVPSTGNGNRDIRAKKMSDGALGDETRIENTLPPPVVLPKQATNDETEMIVNFGGNPHEEIHPLYAYEEQGDSVKIAGKANVVSYDKLPLKVSFVNVEGVGYPSINWDGKLDSIFGAANVDVEILPSKSISIDNPIIQDNSGSGMWSNYTNEMQDIIQQIDGVEEDVYYLIMMQGNVDGSKLGYMPRGKQYGFIYTENIGTIESALVKTVAHELAHGAFKLRHMEDNFEGWSHTGTDLLMEDNPEGTHLTYFEWGRIHNPEGDWSLFDEDEEGEYVVVEDFTIIEEYKTGDFVSFIGPYGEIFSLKYDSLISITCATGGEKYDSSFRKLVPIGSVYSFSIIEDGIQKDYISAISSSASRYRNKDDDNKYYDDPYKNVPVSEKRAISMRLLAKPKSTNGLELAFDLNVIAHKKGHYKVPEKNELQKYDYLLSSFYYFDKQKDNIFNIPTDNSHPYIEAKLIPLSNDNDCIKKSSEFNSEVFKEFAYNYSEYLNVDMMSSFYINGLAKILSISEHYKRCGMTDFASKLTNLETVAKLISNPKSDQDRLVYTSSRYKSFWDDMIPPEQSALADDLINNVLCSLTSIIDEENYPYYDFASANFFNLINLLLDRDNMIANIQKLVDEYDPIDTHTKVFYLVNNIFNKLSSCELEQINFKTYEIQRDMITNIVVNSNFWLTPNDEYVISEIMNFIKKENYLNFLNHLESYEYSTTSLDKYCEVCPDFFLKAQNNKLWVNLIARSADAKPSPGLEIMKKIVEMYSYVAGSTSSNEYNDHYSALFDNVSNIFGNNENTVLLNDVIKIPIVPYDYSTLLGRYDLKLYQQVEGDQLALFGIPFFQFYVYVHTINQTEVKLNEDFTLDILQGQNYFALKFPEDIDKSFYNFKPFDPIIIDTSSSYGITKEFTNQDLESIKVVPACIFYFFKNASDEQDDADAFQILFDVATLPFPASKVLKIGKLITIVDKASSILSLAGTATQSDNPELSAMLNTASMVTGFTSLGVELSATKISKLSNINNNGLKHNKAIEIISESALESTIQGRITEFHKLGQQVENSENIDLLSRKNVVGLKLLLDNPEYAVGGKAPGGGNILKNINAINKLNNVLYNDQYLFLKSLTDSPIDEIAENSEELIKLYDSDIITVQFKEGSTDVLEIKYISQDPNEIVNSDDLIASISPTEFKYKEFDDGLESAIGEQVKYFDKEGTRSINCFSGDCGFGKCFPAGTEVSIEYAFKNIEEIVEGDVVKSFNHQEEKVTFAKVKRTFKSEWNRIVHLFYGDKRISCTPGHKFWLPEKGKYMAADSLMRGVKVLTLAVGLMSLDSVAYADTVYTAYNFEVEDHHNYFVGEDGVLVHNHCALPRANISDELFEQIFPASKYTADELASIRNKLGRDLMPNGSNSPPNAFFDYINLAPNDVVRAERIKAWESVEHLGDGVRLNTSALSKIDELLTNGKIPVKKLEFALKSHLGDVLNAANDVNVGKILDRLKLQHVDEIHFNNIVQRLENYPILKQDLVNNPDWFDTFDDILDNPEKYWDILGEGNVPAGTPLAKWGQGFWWKNLRELADDFEKGAALDKIEDLFGTVYGKNITLKVTNNSTGEVIEIIPDYLALKNGKYHIADAKYTTKSSFTVEKAVTPNQGDVFDWIKNQADITVEVRAANSKLEDIPGLSQGDLLPTTDLKIDILKSKQNDNSIVETVINYH